MADNIIDFSKYESKKPASGINFDSVYDSERQKADAISRGAAELGIDPVDYATAMSYESGKTFDTWAKGPTTKWGQHRGTIQYGEPQRKQYGVYKGQPFDEQVTKSNVQYLKDAGVKPGMTFDQIYAAINGGSVNKNRKTPDANTGRTIADNIRIADEEHRPYVLQRFGQFFTDQNGQVRPITGDGQQQIQQPQSAITPGAPTATPQITPEEAAAFDARFPKEIYSPTYVEPQPLKTPEIPQTSGIDLNALTAGVDQLAQIGEASKAGQPYGVAQTPNEAEYQKWLSTMEGYTDTPERRAEYQAALGQANQFNKQVNAPAIAQDTAAMDAWNANRAKELSTWQQQQPAAVQGMLSKPLQFGKPNDNLNTVAGQWKPENAKDDRDAAIQAMSAVGRHYGITPEQAAKYVDSLAKPLESKWEPGTTVQIGFNDIAKIKGENETKTDIRMEQAQAQPGLVTPQELHVGENFIKQDADWLNKNAGAALKYFNPLLDYLPDALKNNIASSIAGGIIGSGGSTADAVGGIASALNSLPLPSIADYGDLQKKLQEVSETSKQFEKETGDGGIVSQLFKVAGRAPGDVSRLVLFSRLPGGAWAALPADMGLQAAGRGENAWSIAKEAGKGLALAGVLKAAPYVGAVTGALSAEGQTARRAIDEITTLGTITGGTYAVERLTGSSDEQATQSALVMALFHLANQGVNLSGKTVRGRDAQGNEVNVRVDPDGSVKLLKGQVEAPDVEMYFNQKSKTWEPKNQAGAPVPAERSAEPVANLRENNPTRIEVADPTAVQKAQVDTRVRKVTDALKNETDFVDIDALAKKTRLNRTNVEDAVMTLYGARMVEMLPGNKIKLIDPTEVAKQTDLYNKAQNYGQTPPEVPQPAAPVAPQASVPPAETTPSQPSVEPQTQIEPQPQGQAQPVAQPATDADNIQPPIPYKQMSREAADKWLRSRSDAALQQISDEIVPSLTGRKKTFEQAVRNEVFRRKTEKTEQEWQKKVTDKLAELEGNIAAKNSLGGRDPKMMTTGQLKTLYGELERIKPVQPVEPVASQETAAKLTETNPLYADYNLPLNEFINKQAELHGKDWDSTMAAVAMDHHRRIVEQALADGKEVSDTVLRAYPDLAPKATAEPANAPATAEPKPTARPTKTKPPKHQSLSQFVRSHGGIRGTNADRGEHRRISNKETGTTGLINKNSKYTAEHMAEIAWEAGYLRDEWPTSADRDGMALMGFVESDLTGEKKYYALEAFEDFDRDLADKEAEYYAERDRQAEAADEYRRKQDDVIAKQTALLQDPEARQVLAKVAEDGYSVDDALGVPLNEASNKFQDILDQYGIEHGFAIPVIDAYRLQAASPQSESGSDTDIARREPQSADETAAEPKRTEEPRERVARPTLHGVPPQELDPVLRARVLYAKERKMTDADIAERYNLTPEQVASVGTLPEVGQTGQMSFRLIQGLTPSKTATPEEVADKVAKVNDLVSELGLPVENRVTRDSLPGEVKTAVDAIRLAIAKEMGAERASHLTPEQWLKWLDTHADQLEQETVGTILEALGQQIEHSEMKVAPFIKDKRLERLLVRLDEVYDLEKIDTLDGIPNRDIKRAILELAYEYGIKATAAKRAFETARKDFLEGIRESPDTRSVSGRSGGDTEESTPTQVERRSEETPELGKDEPLFARTKTDDTWQKRVQAEMDAVKEVRNDAGKLLAPNGKVSNLPEHLWKAVRTPSFLDFFGDWINDPKNASQVVDENGEPKVLYSGHANIERYDRYNPKAGVAGGFYATEDPEVSSGYALGKRSPSTDYEDDNPGLQYRFKQKNGKFEKKIWQIQLTPEQQDIARRIIRDEYGYDIEEYWKDNKPYDKYARQALMRGGLRDPQSIYRFLENMGNNIVYVDHQDPRPYFEKQQKSAFEEILDAVGIEWQSLDHEKPGTLPVFLNIRNPLTNDGTFPADVLKSLKSKASRVRESDRPDHEQYWTKELPMREWVSDIERGDQFWSTAIPQKALPILQNAGYDGVKEWGNKGAENPAERQANWIAFEPTQIKSIFNRGTWDKNEDNILFARTKQIDQTETPEFKAWFGDSKMVDESGKPIIAFHGTNSEFDTFRSDVGHANDRGFYGKGHYFTFNRDAKWQPAAKGEAGYYGEKIMPVYLKIEKPFDMSKLSEYRGTPIHIVGSESLVFLSNLAKEFPELAKNITLGQYGPWEDGTRSIVGQMPISELPALIEKYRKQLKTYTGEDSYGRTRKYGYVKSETVSYTDADGNVHSWERNEDLSPAGYEVYDSPGREKEIEIGMIAAALEKYEGVEPEYHPEGYMTRNPDITDAIKAKGYDGIVQSMHGDEAVVFEPTQIKSVDNVGDYNPSDPNIYHAKTTSIPGQVDLFGNATSLHALQQDLFGDITPEQGAKAFEKRQSEIVPEKTLIGNNGNFDPNDPRITFNKSALDAESKKLNSEFIVKTNKAQKQKGGAANIITSAKISISPENRNLIRVDTNGLILAHSLLRQSGWTGATLPSGAVMDVKGALGRAYMNMRYDGSEDAAKAIERLHDLIIAATDRETGAVAFSLYEPKKYPVTTKYSAQEESGHLADFKTEARYTATMEAKQFKEADPKAYEKARKAILDQGYSERVAHREFLGKLQRDDATDELNLTAAEVETFQIVRDEQLIEAGMTPDEALDIYGSISKSNDKRLTSYANKYNLKNGSRADQSNEPGDTALSAVGQSGQGQGSGAQGQTDLAREADRPDREGLRLREVPDNAGGLNGKRQTDVRSTGDTADTGTGKTTRDDVGAGNRAIDKLNEFDRKWIEQKAAGNTALQKSLATETLFAKDRKWGHVTVNGKTYNLAKTKEVPLDILNSVRAVKSSVDLSAAGRQGAIVAVNHPILAANAFVKQVSMLPPRIGAKNYAKFKRDLDLHPFIELAQESKLHLTSLGDGSLHDKEEAFMTRLLGDDPYFQNKKLETTRKALTFPVRTSERAYVTFLDDLRINTFAKLAKEIHAYNVRKGQPDDIDQYKGIASFINKATGRGDLGRFEDAAPILGTVFFSPRYWASRLQVLNPAFYAKLPPGARKIAIREMLVYLGAVAGLMALLKAAGFKVEMGDEKNPDLIKLRLGNYSYDFTAGLIGHLRYAARMVMALGDKDPTSTMSYLTERYLRSKLAPIPAGVVNTVQGKNYIGEPTSAKEEALGLFQPIMVDNFKDAAKAEGVAGLLKMSPEFFGISTTRYRQPDEYYKEIQNEKAKLGDNPTPAQQKEYERRATLWKKLADKSVKMRTKEAANP